MENRDFCLPVQNRYGVLSDPPYYVGGNQAGQIVSQVSRQDFAQSSLDNKMVHMFDELRFIRNEQVYCSRELTRLHDTVANVTEKLCQVVSTTNAQTIFLKTLAYKFIDMEARALRNILIFQGFIENYGENCTQVLHDFLKNQLDIDNQFVYIARAHILGQRNPRRKHNHSQLLRTFGILVTYNVL
ncbi:hypothetical protein DPMN_072773 [Dreissena polymorpha]|uniref:Uncharacterized protein n=1 Tax=Dreissena polymorpha TaxID=45954 RepID=A0A9D4HCU8_DREPO|nr:hypothetical protein DPMN_072773 [Dreissena polymorpha]